MSGQRKFPSNSFSSGGGGVIFEVYVQTYIAMHIIAEDKLPFFDSEKPIKMKLQGQYDGYDTDDCIVFGEKGGKVLCQIKHSIRVSDNDVFHSVISDAWKDFSNADHFNRKTDSIVLIVAGLSKTDIDNTRVLFQWSRNCENENEFINKITTAVFSSREKLKKYKAIKKQLQSASNDSISDKEVWEFFRHFNIQVLELDNPNSPLFTAVSNTFSRVVGQSGLENLLYRYVGGYNQNAGTITREKMIEDLHIKNKLSDKSREAIHYFKERLLQQKREHPSFRLFSNGNPDKADASLFPMAIQLSERYMTYHDENDEESKPVKLSEFIAKSWKNSTYRHLQIQGVGGIGKTVTLLSITTEPGFLPYDVPAIYIPLYELNGYSEDKGIEAYLRKHFPNHYETIENLSAEPWYDGPSLILLLDGFNEVVLEKRRDKIFCEIREWAGNCGVQIITTSRSYSGSTEDKFIPITLKKLSEEQVVTFLRRYNNEHKSKVTIPLRGDRLLSVLNIPLMLTLYLQLEEIKEKRKAYPYLEFRECVNAGSLIRNFIQKEIFNYSEYVRGVDIGEFIFSVTAVLPFIMYNRLEKFEVRAQRNGA